MPHRFCGTFRIGVMRNVCGCKHFCTFEIFCELLQPFRKVLQPVSRCPTVIPLHEACGGMSKRSLCWNSMIVQGPPRERHFPPCIGFSSHLWSDVGFDHWPTHQCIRALRTVCLVTGLQCLRGFAPSRRAPGRERILVLPHLFALLHWLQSPL